MSTAAGTEAPKPQSKRDRAFLGQLPSDFLRVESATTAQSSSGYACVCAFMPIRYTLYSRKARYLLQWCNSMRSVAKHVHVRVYEITM